jgi:hypothetical protein
MANSAKREVEWRVYQWYVSFKFITIIDYEDKEN